jgi:hypothetical protein
MDFRTIISDLLSQFVERHPANPRIFSVSRESFQSHFGFLVLGQSRNALFALRGHDCLLN